MLEVQLGILKTAAKEAAVVIHRSSVTAPAAVPLLLHSWGGNQSVTRRRLYVMSLTRVCFICSVWFVTLGQVCVGSEADNAQKWHSDIPSTCA